MLSRQVMSDCDPMDCSLSCSSVHGILQAKILEWVAMPSSGIFPIQRSNPCLPLWQADSLLLSHQGSPFKLYIHPTDTMTMKINELLTNNMVESHKHNTESKRLKREYTVWFQLFKVKKWKLIYGKGGFLWGEGNSDLKGTQEGFLGDW